VHTNQYSYSELFRTTREVDKMPAVYFHYEISPIMAMVRGSGNGGLGLGRGRVWIGEMPAVCAHYEISPTMALGRGERGNRAIVRLTYSYKTSLPSWPWWGGGGTRWGDAGRSHDPNHHNHGRGWTGGPGVPWGL
jgi:hypothetical protein